jgi:hypothetical protein
LLSCTTAFAAGTQARANFAELPLAAFSSNSNSNWFNIFSLNAGALSLNAANAGQSVTINRRTNFGLVPLIINGKPAPVEAFKSVVQIGGCTAAKVGPRHFVLAAHCFFIGPGEFRPRTSVTVWALQTASPQEFQLTAQKIHLHPTWLEACKSHACTGFETGSAADVPGKVDLALVIVAEPTPEIETAQLDYDPLPAGEKVTLTGIGCTKGIREGRSEGLRLAQTQTIPPDALKHPGSLYSGIWEMAGKSYFVTPGNAANPEAASLCPGDSGGPVFRGTGAEARIIGINSDYTFDGPYEARGAISRTNLHTRIDDASLHQVGPWLRERVNGKL